jgi:Aspartyl protease
MAVVQNVTLGTLTDEIHLDAVIDTGSTLCVVPPIFARQLGFNSSNRLEGGLVRVIGGGTVQMDKHRLERVRVGSAMASAPTSSGRRCTIVNSSRCVRILI